MANIYQLFCNIRFIYFLSKLWAGWEEIWLIYLDCLNIFLAKSKMCNHREIIRLIWNCIPNSVWSIPSKCMQIVTDWNWLLQLYNCDLWSDNCLWIFNCTFNIYSDGWFVSFIQTNMRFILLTLFLAQEEKESKLKCMDGFHRCCANYRCFTWLKSW